jgi:predicted nucleotidyltransferase component of viral defense system
MLDQAKHRFHLIKLLESIYSNKDLAYLLGFKGGTAAYLFYDLPRFSTDLDFDLISKAENLNEKNTSAVFDSLSKLFKNTYEVKDQNSKVNTLFWLLSYEKNLMNIKIEVNTRKFPNTYETKNFYGSSIQLMKIGDMIAHKLVASMDRKAPANRDLFDIDFFLKSKYAIEINYEIIKFRTGLDTKDFYTKLLKYVDKYDKKNILNGLGEVLNEDQKSWVKNKLLAELKNSIQIQLDIHE